MYQKLVRKIQWVLLHRKLIQAAPAGGQLTEVEMYKCFIRNRTLEQFCEHILMSLLTAHRQAFIHSETPSVAYSLNNILE